MKELLDYLKAMDPAARTAFAARCATSLGYIRKAASTGQALKIKTCVAVERESHRRVRRWTMRDDWYEIWPDLIGTEGAPPVPAAEPASTMEASHAG